LVRVHAAGVNPVDCEIRNGAFAAITGERLPVVLGQDVSGTVELCGRTVGELDLGQATMCWCARPRQPPSRAGSTTELLRACRSRPPPPGRAWSTTAGSRPASTS